MSDYIHDVVLNTVKVNGVDATPGAIVWDSQNSTPTTQIYTGSFNFSSGTVDFTLALNSDGTYAVDLGKVFTDVVITPNEYAGAVHASGPTDTYLISYTDSTSGNTVTAKVSVEAQGQTLTLYGFDDQGAPHTYTATTTGTQINPSSDGIGVTNNVLSSKISSSGALTAESLRFDPPGDAKVVTLNFKATGDVGFGAGGSEDVIYVQVHGTNGEVQTVMLDSQHGDFIVNANHSLTAIATGSYTGGVLSSYAITASDVLHVDPAIDYITVTAGFYMDSKGHTQESDVKVTFGFATETTSTLTLPVEMHVTTTVTDADHDLASSSFSVLSQAGTVFTGTGGDDVITGTAGNDTISGGAGNDTLAGLAGVDTFVWHLADAGTSLKPALDTVKDFNTGDVLQLNDLITGNTSATVVVDAGTNTTVHVTDASNHVQTIVLEGYSTDTGAALAMANLLQTTGHFTHP
jgi:Ca2+-binding RTX toxin-like protein